MEKYKVKTGDTLETIAKKYGITVNAIKSANNLKSNTLNTGQVLNIPLHIKTFKIKEIKIPIDNTYVHIPEKIFQKNLKIQPVKEYVIFVLQGYGGDPADGSERAKDDNNSSVDYDGLGKLTELNSKHVKVYVYSSSTTENTKNAVLKMIKYFRKINKDVKIIMVGHSQGADNTIELTEENTDIIFDLVITLDSKDATPSGKIPFTDSRIPGGGGIEQNDIEENVKNVINYYQRGETLNGEILDIQNPKSTKGANILSPGSNHRSIDNDLKDYIIEDIKNFINGNDAVDLAKKRKLPTFDPKNSNSEKMSYNDYKNEANTA